MLQWIKKVLTAIIDWFLYTLLSEKQKERLANLFSERQKERLKKITRYGKRHTQKRQVKHIKDHLYSLGFTERALTELKNMYRDTNDSYLKRLVAWELTLWYANQYTKADAKRALTYIEGALEGEKDHDQLRRIAIIKAECLEQIGEVEAARKVIT